MVLSRTPAAVDVSIADSSDSISSTVNTSGRCFGSFGISTSSEGFRSASPSSTRKMWNALITDTVRRMLDGLRWASLNSLM